jgi:GNAT superfamily N-acetyltransferase
MTVVDVERTFLELCSPADLTPSTRAPADPPPLASVSPISPAAYRVVYRAVGERWYWRDRLAWSDERLEAQLARADVHVWILGDPRDPDGFFELQGPEDGSIEIAYFGLVPRAMGRGLGAWMLTRAVEEAWRAGGGRAWLHTCTLDSPHALPNYLARGFREFRREHYTAELPDGRR